MSAARRPAILGGTPLFAEPYHLVKPALPPREEFAGRLRELYRSRILTNQGAQVRALEERLSEFIGVKHCALFCNATVALMVLLRALDLEGEVILPSFTFAATAQAALWARLRPRFVDIDPGSLMLDPGRVAAAVGRRTAAILGVNLFGSCCDHDRLRAVADRHGLPLLYDSAQAFGTRYRGRMAGALGDAEVFSFHATKLFHTGEGGAIVTGDPGLYARVCRMRNFGFAAYLDCVDLGLNGKMPELSALLGLSLLRDLPRRIAQGRRVCREYRRRLGAVPGLSLPEPRREVSGNHSYFPVLVDPAGFGLSNLELNLALLHERIVTRCYFYPPVHRTGYFRGLSRRSGGLPETDRAARRVLCLPVRSDMRLEELERIVEAIVRCRVHAPAVRARAAGRLPAEWEALGERAADPYDELILGHER
ncbi:MAG: DegT/DnrJ/EryC1/StrS family aminotransferase [Elusimicrobia bacterium]|nr:DegT/DnrJ/EryC1/StrS family aminotransferase [Elusimicrobiota bacterium]